MINCVDRDCAAMVKHLEMTEVGQFNDRSAERAYN